MRPERFLLAVLTALLVGPAPIHAQLGAIEAFANRVTDLSFYFTGGTLTGSGPYLEREFGQVTGFGVELLFEVAEVERAEPGTPVEERTDSVERVWTGMEVVHSQEGVDTIYTYEVERLPPPEPSTETLWTLEMGLGYGQLQGYELLEPSLDMNVSVRELPSVTLYANYEPWGNYFGIRSGFMRTQALQILDDEGSIFSGEADAFLFGGLVGYAFDFQDLWLVVETGYTLRTFPSVEWSGPGPLPDGVPRELDMSAWTLSAGIQFPFR